MSINSSVAVVLAAQLLLACPLEPRRSEVQVALTPKTARVQATLRDLRAPTADGLDQFHAVLDLTTPADLKALGVDLEWLGTPARYELVVRDGGVDLELDTTIARSVFDACAAKACQDEHEQRCALFAVRSCSGKYQADLEDDFAVAPGAVTSWPLTATTLALAVDLKSVKPNRPADAVERIQREPKAARATAAWMADLAKSFAAADLKARVALEKDSDARTDGFSGLRREALHRHQLHLLHAFLARGPERSGLTPSPLKVDSEAEPAGLPPARTAVPEAFTKQLKAIYETAVAPLAHGDDHVLSVDGELWSLCEKKPKGPGPRALCLALLGREQRGKPK